MTDEEKAMRAIMQTLPFPLRVGFEIANKMNGNKTKNVERSSKTQSESSTPVKSNSTRPKMPIVHKKEYYGDNVAEVTTVIRISYGMCARPCSVFVSHAEKFRSKIQLTARGKTVDAKSILMLMSMGLVYGTEITISASGSDACEAVKTLVELIDVRFAEV